MLRSLQQLNKEFADLKRQFDEAPDNQSRVVISEEMHLLFREMETVLKDGRFDAI